MIAGNAKLFGGCFRRLQEEMVQLVGCLVALESFINRIVNQSLLLELFHLEQAMICLGVLVG